MNGEEKCKWQFKNWGCAELGAARIKLSCKKAINYYSTRGLGYKFCPYCGKEIEHE